MARLEEIREAIQNEGFSIKQEEYAEVYNGRKGTVVNRHTLVVSKSSQTSEAGLLSNDPGVYRWDEVNGRLYAFEVVEGNATSIVIEMGDGLEHRI